MDGKGDDAEAVARQCEASTVKDGRLHYIDLANPEFSINLLELPLYHQRERKDTVSFQIHSMSDIIKDWCSGNDALKNVLAGVVSDALEYMYLDNDCPTLDGLYELLSEIEHDGSRLPAIYEALGRAGPKSQDTIRAVAKTVSLHSVLNRLEWLVLAPTSQRMFCQKRSTVNFGKLLLPGHYTVARLNGPDVNQKYANAAIRMFVTKLWFRAMWRAKRSELAQAHGGTGIG